MTRVHSILITSAMTIMFITAADAQRKERAGVWNLRI